MKSRAQGLKALIHRGVKRWLARQGYTTPTLMIVGFEGNADEVTRVRSAAFRVLKTCGGFHLGTKPGETWSKEKFNLPYLRDWVMDRGVMVDVAETSGPVDARGTGLVVIVPFGVTMRNETSMSSILP